jgi:hypothetical protein
MKKCPCCGCNVVLVRGDVIESHPPVSTDRERPKRAGIWCDGSGYTLAQAERWSALPDDVKRELLAARPNYARGVAA